MYIYIYELISIPFIDKRMVINRISTIATGPLFLAFFMGATNCINREHMGGL